MLTPLACAALTVSVNGQVLHAYRAVCLVAGRVLAPVDPFVVAVVASVEYDGSTIVVRRGDRFVQVPAAPLVEIGPMLRTLGLQVTYDPKSARVDIRAPQLPYATPTPFNPAVPESPPLQVFTPSPAPTPRPVVSGSPSPRRTPLPLNEPQSLPSP